MSVYPPTFLYVKQHKITKKLYFGKTQSKDPVKYLGSGKHWVSHIKKHGKEHVETLWFCLFLDKESLREFALSFSKAQNIVASKEWLNLKDENGLDGNLIGNIPWNIGLPAHNKGKTSPNSGSRGIPKSAEWKAKISNSLTGKSRKFLNRKQREPINHNKISCPHCNKIGGSNIMKRWHFEKCKMNVVPVLN